MIIEIHDILENKQAVGHSQPPPPGTTLGEIFDHSDKLKQLAAHIVQVTLNGSRVTDWRGIKPERHDVIIIDVMPGTFGGLTGLALFAAYASVVSAVLSVVSFLVSIFTRPKPIKSDVPKDSTTYSWEGIKTSYSPGGPVPVCYGIHATGGQLLSLAVDVLTAEHQQLSMLVGLGHGIITEVNCVKINGVGIENFNDPALGGDTVCQAAAERYWTERPDVAVDPGYGRAAGPTGAYQHYIDHGQAEGMSWHGELCSGATVSWDWRPGTSDQSAIAGFEEVRNTFADGREVSTLSVVYAAQGNDIDKMQLQVAAMQGLGFFWGGTNPRLGNQTVYYKVEYQRVPPATTWQLYTGAGFDGSGIRTFTGATRAEAWDAPTLDFNGDRAGWNIRLTYIDYSQKERGAAKGDASLHHIWLRNITEISGLNTQTYSSNGLLAVKAIATNQLQGGAPTVTCAVMGRRVRDYSATSLAAADYWVQRPDVATDPWYGASHDGAREHYLRYGRYEGTTWNYGLGTPGNGYLTTWTRNPAWCVLDYMMNQVFGMGGFIDESQINMQSFLDFAYLCDSMVSDGAGGLEPQHFLDLMMDKKHPHWQWVNDILALYNSNIIFSQGKYKIITERADLPVRQVFHSGNIVPGTFQLAIGASDPTKPNQVNIAFANPVLEYNMDTLYVQDSASVYGLGEPIKDFDISLIGITRQSEVLRTAHRQLFNRRNPIKEIRFKTGLEALAVEPGDLCKVGIATTDFQLGYGGRVLEGNQEYLILDREITVNSGYGYECYLWHTNNDSVEARILDPTRWAGVVSQPTITVYPTLPFAGLPAVGDRWAIGVTSEDLLLSWVKKVSRDNTGLHDLTVEQANSISVTVPDFPVSSWWGAIDLQAPPPQPISVVGSVQMAYQADNALSAMVSIDVVPAPREEGGFLKAASLTLSGYESGVKGRSILSLGGSHSSPFNSLSQDYIRFLTGTYSVRAWRGLINQWYGATTGPNFGPGEAVVAPPLPNAMVPTSTAYEVVHKGGNWAGFDVYQVTQTASGYKEALVASPSGTHWEQTTGVGSFDATGYRIVPFNSLGTRNWTGIWSIGLGTQGYVTTPNTPSGLAATVNAKGVVLSWNVNSDPGVVDYGVFRNTTNAFATSSLLTHVRGTLFLDAGATAENSYSYWVRAYNTMGNASPVHPGVNSGVTAATVPINNFVEFVSTDSFAIPYGLNPSSGGIPKLIRELLITSLAFLSYGGNLKWEVSMDVKVNSQNVSQYFNHLLHVWQPGATVPYALKAYRFPYLANSSFTQQYLSVTDVYTPEVAIFTWGVSQVFTPYPEAVYTEYRKFVLWETQEQ